MMIDTFIYSGLTLNCNIPEIDIWPNYLLQNFCIISKKAELREHLMRAE